MLSEQNRAALERALAMPTTGDDDARRFALYEAVDAIVPHDYEDAARYLLAADTTARAAVREAEQHSYNLGVHDGYAAGHQEASQSGRAEVRALLKELHRACDVDDCANRATLSMGNGMYCVAHEPDTIAALRQEQV